MKTFIHILHRYLIEIFLSWQENNSGFSLHTEYIAMAANSITELNLRVSIIRSTVGR
jgi:hypothetical protein